MREKDLVDLVNNQFEYAKRGISQLRSKWFTRYKYWKAEERIKRPQYTDNVRIPIIFEISDGIMSLLTDNQAKMKFYPQEEGDLKSADQLQQVISDYYWDKLKLFRISEEVIWWAMNISGSGLAKIAIDPLTTDYYVEACNSFCCFPDPSAKTLNTCEFFIYMSVRSINDLKRIYGKRVNDVTPQDELSLLALSEEEVISPWARDSGKSENMKPYASGESKNSQDYDRTSVFEAWMKDDTMEKIPFEIDEVLREHDQFRNLTENTLSNAPQVSPQENHPEHIIQHLNFIKDIEDDSLVPADIYQLVIQHLEDHNSYPQETKKMKYPYGKFVTIASDVLLDERTAPFGLPYSKMDFVLDPTQFWGVTLQQYLQTLQDSMQRRKRQISDSADRMANPREFYIVGSGYDPTKVTGKLGEQVGVKMPGAVWQEELKQLPNHVLLDLQDSEQKIEKIAGWHEVMQGIYPKGSPSGITIANLKESLGPRIRKATRHYEWFLKDLIRILIRMLRYEDPKKTYLITGEQGMPIYLNADDLNLSGEYDVRIEAGSTLPSSRQEKLNNAIQLKQYGIYDNEAVLEYIDDPKKDDIIKRLSENEQLKGIIQAMQERLAFYEGEQNEQTESNRQNTGSNRSENTTI